MLAGYFTVFTIFSIHSWLTESGEIYNYPYLVGTTLPLYFLPSVFSFVYMRTIVVPKYRWKKADWLHLLPTLLCIIDLAPFYLVGSEEKMQQVALFVAGRSAAVLEEKSITGFHIYLPSLLAMGIYYLLLIFSLLARFKQQLEDSGNHEINGMFTWLGVFAGLFFLFWLGNSLDFISRQHVNGQNLALVKNTGTSFTLIITVLLLALFAKPILQFYRGK